MMINKKLNLWIILILIFILTACEVKNTTNNEIKSKSITNKYVDFEKFKEGRLCAEVKFSCLPESLDKVWQSTPLKDGLDTFELSKQNIEKYDTIVKEWHKKYDAYHAKSHPKGEKKPMLISSLDKDFFDKVSAKRFLVEMEESLEKEFPGFWREVAKPVRYRWIRRAMSKAKKLGYKSDKPNGIIELCARIGLDFDLDPKWNEITRFILLPKGYTLSYEMMAVEYIDFTVFNKDKNMVGDTINGWSLREALAHLPKPKRPIPRLND